MTKHQFASFANHMLLGAVNAVRQDLQPGAKLDEPAYTASIVTKFPALMDGSWGRAMFGGCFIHQSPIATMSNGTDRCEVGDLLVLCKKQEGTSFRYNAALFQLKRAVEFRGVKPDNQIQLNLYTYWPEFSLGRRYIASSTDSNHFNIQPKSVTPGAQYMFINENPYQYWNFNGYLVPFGYPVVYTHSIPEGVMANTPELSFGMFLWNFIQWQDGRPISESAATANDDWSKLIWALIVRSQARVFNHKGINAKNATRAQGNFFEFMLKPSHETGIDTLYHEWLSLGNSQAAPEMKESDDRRSEDDDSAISILYIDLDGSRV